MTSKPASAKWDIRGLFAAFTCGVDWELGKNTELPGDLLVGSTQGHEMQNFQLPLA
jgi:hypothetical protein